MAITYWFFWPVLIVALGIFMKLSTSKNRDRMASITVLSLVAVFVAGFIYESMFP